MIQDDTKIRLMQFVISLENNPIVWTEDTFKDKLSNGEVVGYLLRRLTGKFNTSSFLLTLYVIKPEYIETANAFISLNTLRNVFIDWLEGLVDTPDHIVFCNPPIKEWLDTKENWVKKIAGALASKYRMPYDECLSALFYVIMVCYNKKTVYMGNLNYLEIAANNKIKMDIRDMKNRLHGNHPLVISLDVELADDDNGVTALHDVVGGQCNPCHAEYEYEAFEEAVMDDLEKDFSQREIEQILSRNQLPIPLYRRLLKWKKTHKRSDYK